MNKSVFQLATPVFFLVGPIGSAVYAILTGIQSSESVVKSGLLMIALYGLTNSLFTILFVSPYRRHALNLVFLVLGKILKIFGLEETKLSKRWLNTSSAPNSVI